MIRDKKHLIAIRDMPCFVTCQIATDDESVVPAHIRTGTDGGMGMKPSDCYVIPLLNSEHQKQHAMGEIPYWLRVVNEDPRILMRLLAANAKNEIYTKSEKDMAA